MSEIIYSIVIPHYNIPDLLERALNSIPEREDIEVIIVDDNSDPSKIDSEHFPGLNRLNTHCIFLKKNGGAGIARNTAISTARGRWILCIDADDFLLKDAFDKIDKYRYSDSDVVVFKADSCMSDNVTQKGNRYHAQQLCGFIDECLNGEREVRNLLFSIWSPWCKLVKRKLLIDNKITFATTPVSEDVIWSTGVAIHSKKAEVSGDCIYCLTEREGSLTSDVNVEKLAIWCDILKERNAYLHKYNYDEYYFYFSYDELLFLRKKGVFTYIKFCVKCLRYNIMKPCTMYSIEKKFHFRYPYLFLLLALLGFPKINKSSILYKLWKKQR